MDPVSRPAGFRGWICPICRLPCVCTGPVKGWMCSGCMLMYHTACMERQLRATGVVEKTCLYCEDENEDEDKDEERKQPKMTSTEWKLCMPIPKNEDGTIDGEDSNGASTSKRN